MKKLVFIMPLMALSFLTNCGSKPIAAYTVTFISNGGSAVEPLLVEEGKTIDKPTDPVKENMTFYNWYTNKHFVGEPFDFNTPIDGELVLYARWGYKVTFYSSDTIYKEQVTPESTLVEPPPEPSIEYHDFTGWYTNPSCEEEYLYKFDKAIESNLSLYSNFTCKKYDIIYHDLLVGDTNPNPESYVYGVGVDELKDAIRNNYTFVGWFTDTEHTLSITSISTSAHGIIDLYPKFTDEYKITYPNWPEDIPNPNPTEYSHRGETITLDPNIFADEKYEGLHFKNYLDENKNPITQIPSGSAGDRTIYLDYDADEVTIDFNANGGRLDSKTFDNINLNYCQEDTENVEITGIPQVSDSKLGYNPNTADHLDRDDKYFAGWYFDENYTQPLVESDSEVNEVQSGDTLYAKWNEKKDDDYVIANKEGVTINFHGSIAGPTEIQHRFNANIPFYASKIDISFRQTHLSLVTTSRSITSKAVDSEGFYNKQIFETYDVEGAAFNFDTPTTLESSEGVTFTVGSCYVLYKSGIKDLGTSVSYGADVTFTTSKDCYRNQLVKVKNDQGSKKVKYWDLVNVGNPSREGYNFAGWSKDGVYPIDLGKHYQFTNDTQLKALWEPIV